MPDTHPSQSLDYELPLYRSPSLPLLPPVSLGDQYPASAPLQSLQPLYPVHHIILHHLADLAPTKALTLSRYCYSILSPYIYRYAKASKSLLRGLELETGYERKLKALKYVETLSLEDKTGVWHIAMLAQPGNVPRVYEGVFAGVMVLETSQEVREGGYHECVPPNPTRLSFSDMLERIEPQLGDGWVEKVKEGEDSSDDRSMYFTIEGTPQDVPGAPVQLPVPPAPVPVSTAALVRDCLKALLTFLVGASVVFGPVIFFALTSLATEPIHRLAITTLAADWVVETRPDGNITVPVKINVGVASGCIWYNRTGPSCSWALPWRPDPALLHLPANETLTKTFPSTNGGALILVHALTAASVISVVFTLTDPKTTTVVGNTSFSKRSHLFTFGVFIAGWVTFGIVYSYNEGLKGNIEKDSVGMGYKHHTGGAVWLLLAGAMVHFFWFTVTIPT